MCGARSADCGSGEHDKLGLRRGAAGPHACLFVSYPPIHEFTTRLLDSTRSHLGVPWDPPGLGLFRNIPYHTEHIPAQIVVWPIHPLIHSHQQLSRSF